MTAPKKSEFVGKPAVAVAQDAPRPKSKTRVGGAALVPDLDSKASSAGVSTQYRYWVGVTPDCPRESIDLAGINFPKVNARLTPDPMRTNVKQRVPVIGAIVYLTEDKIRKMLDVLPRTVIRFTDDNGQNEEPGTGKNIGDNHARPRKGHIITIPTDEDIKQRRAAGKSARSYVPDPKRDVPAARFMFAQLCADQANGSRGEVYPDTLENTGLEWPDEIAGTASTDEVS
jgi:hypothetical protein